MKRRDLIKLIPAALAVASLPAYSQTRASYTLPRTYQELEHLFKGPLSGPQYKRARVAFALEHAYEVEHLMTDWRSRDALRAARDYVNGRIGDVELRAAANAAAHPAYAAVRTAAARDAAMVASTTADACWAPHVAAYAAAGTVKEAIKWSAPLPQKTLDRLEKWFPRG